MNFNIDKNEVLRYMGYKNQEIDEILDKKIDSCIDRIKRDAKPRYTMAEYDIENVEEGILVSKSTFILKGNNIKRHLKGCNKVILLAATLGGEVDKVIKLNERICLEDGIILDACATTLIESFCDNIEKEILANKKKEGKSITFRYSPGYGDFPIECQRDFVGVVDGSRKIGLCSTSNNILVPRKSVTAIIGVYDEIRELKKRSCEDCSNYDKCLYRRKGVSCGD
ncbi:methionine synthase [Clostridium sp.]|uniref:methionine synthase n=1 Tax=Clostridium sp. TaxID=1506 RepID=UPI0039931C9D